MEKHNTLLDQMDTLQDAVEHGVKMTRNKARAAMGIEPVAGIDREAACVTVIAKDIGQLPIQVQTGCPVCRYGMVGVAHTCMEFTAPARLPGGMQDQQDPDTLPAWLAQPAEIIHTPLGESLEQFLVRDVTERMNSKWTDVRVFCDPKMPPDEAMLISGDNVVKVIGLDMGAGDDVCLVGCGKCGLMHVDQHGIDTWTNAPHVCKLAPMPDWFAPALLEARRLDAEDARAKRNQGNALITLLHLLQIPRNAQIIPGRGEPFLCESDKMTTINFTKPGVAGEFKVTFKVDHIPPYKPAVINQTEEASNAPEKTVQHDSESGDSAACR
jgi:hypothetical protein